MRSPPIVHLLLATCALAGCTEENPTFTSLDLDQGGQLTDALLDGELGLDLEADADGAQDLTSDADTGADLPPITPDLPPVTPDLPPVTPDLPPVKKDLPPVKPDQKVLLNNGAACTSGGQCKTGHCVDKLCCSGPCSGLCRACNLSGKKGTCTFVPAGADPRNACKKVDPHNTCKFDGTCNGKGGCRYYPAGTKCLTAKCASAVALALPSVCDGGGNCLKQKIKPCKPYNCSTTAKTCYSGCTDKNEQTNCQGYYGCNVTNSKCYSSCTSDAHCNKKGSCDKKKKVCKKK